MDEQRPRDGIYWIDQLGLIWRSDENGKLERISDTGAAALIAAWEGK